MIMISMRGSDLSSNYPKVVERNDVKKATQNCLNIKIIGCIFE